MRWGLRWSQSEGGPLAHAVGASVVPKRRRPPRPCGGEGYEIDAGGGYEIHKGGTYEIDGGGAMELMGRGLRN